MTNKITTTIKRTYMDQILQGSKTTEFKGAKKFWKTRLHRFAQLKLQPGQVLINFVCGQDSYKFNVNDVLYVKKKTIIDGKTFSAYYAISLGERYQEIMIQKTLEPESMMDLYYRAYLDGRVLDNPHLCFRWGMGTCRKKHICENGAPCKKYTQREDEAQKT